ncbi:hypothetical protein [Georgenia deserti]|uniref:Uncharacterized protein n=1 Tax=Georgenia deserti TaxID=2093781 RepID=A0ABW4L139_9MICO
MELQGYVVAALTLILLGYLLPHLVRSRQVLLDSRVDDRFSGDLRIVATGAAPRDRNSRGHTTGATPHLHTSAARRPEGTMTPPRARSERVIDDARALAAARAARAARVSRRAAAARRRLVLTLALLVLTGAAWAAAGAALLPWPVALAPSLLLATVLVLGRRAAVKARANDRRDRAEMARLESRLKAVRGGAPRERKDAPARSATSVAAPSAARPRPTAAHRPTARPRPVARSGAGTVSRADAPVHHGKRPTELVGVADEVAVPAGTSESRRASAPAEAGTPLGAERPVAQEASTPAPPADTTPLEPEPRAPGRAPADEGPLAQEEPAPALQQWTPVPVPAPSYTLKPVAPRRDVEPYVPEEESPSAAVPQRPSSPGSTPEATRAEEEPAAPALNLDEVLARRRAAGA